MSMVHRDTSDATRGPAEQLVNGPGVDDPVRLDAVFLGAGASVDLEVQLAGRVRVGVDREQATDIAGQLQEGIAAARGRRPAVFRGV